MSFRLLQFGDSGVGKSVRASEAARWGLVEIHDFDQQSDNLKRYLSIADPERLKNIKFVSYAGLTNIAKIDRFVDRVRKLVEARNTNKAPDIATLVIDSYTSFEQYYVEYLTSKYIPSSTGFGSPRSEFDIGSEGMIIPGTMDYNVLAVAMKKEFDRWKATDINIILNAHEKDPLEMKGKVVKQGTVKAAGQIRDLLPTEMNEFHRLFIDGMSGGHRVQAKPTALFLAKTALAKVPSNGILSDNSLKVFDEIAFKLETTNQEKK